MGQFEPLEVWFRHPESLFVWIVKEVIEVKAIWERPLGPRGIRVIDGVPAPFLGSAGHLKLRIEWPVDVAHACPDDDPCDYSGTRAVPDFVGEFPCGLVGALSSDVF